MILLGQISYPEFEALMRNNFTNSNREIEEIQIIPFVVGKSLNVSYFIRYKTINTPKTYNFKQIVGTPEFVLAFLKRFTPPQNTKFFFYPIVIERVFNVYLAYLYE